ncbi:hypothetical protein LXL04_016589 [Taraxacum kok-saghyz]
MELDYGLNCSPFTATQVLSELWQSLDSQRNYLEFYKNSLNQNQELLDSRYVAEEEGDNQGFRVGSNGFPFHHSREGNLSAGGLRGAAAAQPLLPPQKKRSHLLSLVEDENVTEEKMEGNYQYEQQGLHQQPSPAGGSSRLGSRNCVGEIVEVQGGHIVRATGRKDRHSKVCTAKGPRDRRVRLAAHTAIQFYDVQDRLGYDRPSKAVDWLIKKAKTAIDELAELPAWNPTSTTTATTISTTNLNFEQSTDRENTNHHALRRFGQHPNDGMIDSQMRNTQNSSFLPQSLDSDSIADTIKSFFPMGASSAPPNDNSSAMQFHQSFSPPDLLSRSSNQSQDLRLSLQSFKDPNLHHHHQSEEEGTPSVQQHTFDTCLDGPATVNKRKTTASLINRPLLPLTLAIDSPSFFISSLEQDQLLFYENRGYKEMIQLHQISNCFKNFISCFNRAHV